MGGDGSGRRFHVGAKNTVESCRVLNINWMIREGIFDGGGRKSGVIRWCHPISGKAQSRLSYEADLDEQWLRLEYRLVNEDKVFDYRLPLTTSVLPWGGVRWWFRCSLSCNRQYCGRRVGKLYLPRVASYFGCRHCYDLTYESCNDSRSRMSASDILMKEFGLSQHTEREALKDFRGGLKSDRQLENKYNKREQRRRRRKARDWS